ncbi:RPS6 [Symbiodinium sp. CCMP2592]|nr:RPS6 [Symbiodinium sp. CCMP2592]
MASALAQIFITEVLGYHAVIVPERVLTSIFSFPVLAGCSDWECTEATARSHVALDVWVTGKNAELQDFEEQNPSRSPEDLGSIGYAGHNALCLSGAVRDAAYGAIGLALEFYKSYNLSYHQANSFFDPLSELKLEDFLPCNTSFTRWTRQVQLEAYLHWTGDVGGVTNSSGSLQAHCPDGHFWLSPACRHDLVKCIPVVTAGDGWSVQVMMQWAFFHGMPVAVGIARDFDLYAAYAAQSRSLFYCWLPDATHVHIDPSLLQFPRHEPSEWEASYYRTSDAESRIAKIVSRDLRSKAPRVVKFLENFELDLSGMQDLLSAATNSSVEQVACEWVRSQRGRWQQWVPVETQCVPGYGLATDASGLSAHVDNRSEAAGCSICTAGKVSEQFSDEHGATYRCVPCSLGTAQSALGQTLCTPCEVGTYADQRGRAHCRRCELGRYANVTGASDCDACGGGNRSTTSRLVSAESGFKWIEVDGAATRSFCGCVPGWFLSSDGLCMPCIRGSSCPGSSQMELLPGYFALEPGNVFQCFGDASRCPGGVLGTCADGRDGNSVTCYDCLPGLQPDRDGTCRPCTGTSYVVILFAACAVVVLIAALYVSLNMDVDRTTQEAHLSLFVLAMRQFLTVAQQLAVINKFGIAWEEPVDRILRSFEFMGLNLDMLAISCLSRMSPVTKYALRTCAAPISAFVALLVHLVALAIRNRGENSTRCELRLSRLLRTVGSVCKIFFIAILSSILAPFQCNEHPNGMFTVQEYHSVFCNSRGPHLTMSIVGAVASLMPLSFLVLCMWMTWIELPKRLVRADATYFRACAFLWSRFRPGAEAYSVLYLVRNGLLAVVPVLPSVSAQIVTMNLILYCSSLVVSFVQPWCSKAGNLLDVMLHIGLLVVLDMASAFARFEDSATSVAISLIFLLHMFLAIVIAAAYGILLHVARRRRKPWRFFLSHQKSTTGSFARLLKTQLLKRSSRFTTFMDTDDLRDLTELFGYVRGTQTFVILASPGILQRRWCIGEAVTAKLSKIPTVMVRWPGFQDPDEHFRENLSFAIPGIEILASYSLSLEDVSETLTWISTVESLAMPTMLNLQTIGRLCDSLTGAVSPRLISEEARSPDCVLLVDPDNLEAVATAYVLYELLLPFLNTALRCSLPYVLKKGQGVPVSTSTALLICSTGCLHSFHMSNWILDAVELDCGVIPVIAEPGFVVPVDFKWPDDGDRILDYAEVVQAIFKGIATVFAPQLYSSTQEDLQLRAKQIAYRPQSKMPKLGSRLTPTLRLEDTGTRNPLDFEQLGSVGTASGNLPQADGAQLHPVGLDEDEEEASLPVDKIMSM